MVKNYKNPTIRQFIFQWVRFPAKTESSFEVYRQATELSTFILSRWFSAYA